MLIDLDSLYVVFILCLGELASINQLLPSHLLLLTAAQIENPYYCVLALSLSFCIFVSYSSCCTLSPVTSSVAATSASSGRGYVCPDLRNLVTCKLGKCDLLMGSYLWLVMSNGLRALLTFNNPATPTC